MRSFFQKDIQGDREYAFLMSFHIFYDIDNGIKCLTLKVIMIPIKVKMTESCSFSTAILKMVRFLERYDNQMSSLPTYLLK